MESRNSLLSTEGSSFLGWMSKLFSGCGQQPVAASVVTTLPKQNPMNYSGRHQIKKAVLCGVSYQNFQKKKYKLKGPINDVKRMKDLLVDCFGYPDNAICVLIEEQNDPDLIPTKMNIQKAMKWLVEDCMSGDSLVFFFSGHGLRQLGFHGSESDEYDETICPTDFTTAGMICDNYIYDTIVKPLKPGAKLHAIIDACHSGSILDLSHVYKPKLEGWVDNKSPSSESTNGGLAICFSACADNQTAADTNVFTGKEMSGALTSVFVRAIRANQQITYRKLLDEMQSNIKDANNTGGCLGAPFLSELFLKKLAQEPQLSSSQIFDVDKVFVM